jgi:hypothetical protein
MGPRALSLWTMRIAMAVRARTPESKGEEKKRASSQVRILEALRRKAPSDALPSDQRPGQSRIKKWK